MADKLIQLIDGVLTEVEATVTSAGAGDAGKVPALDAAGKLDETVLPSTVGAQVTSAPASENIADGDIVNLWDDSGTIKVRKADADSIATRAVGFVKAGYSTSQSVTVYLSGTNDHVTGLTVGPVYLATTAGGITSTPPSGSGDIVQPIGFAVSATELAFNPGPPIVLA